MNSLVTSVKSFVRKISYEDMFRCFLIVAFLTLGLTDILAQSPGGAAFTKVESEIISYVPLVRKVIYAIAGVVAIVGAGAVFFKMNNEDNDVKKAIMMIIGACIFLVAAAEALPLFFGISD